MSDDDKKKSRMEVLRGRHEDDGGGDESQKEDSEDESNSAPDRVRERQARTMYAGKDVINEIEIKYEELSPRYRREHGEKLEKNAVFYPALLRAGVYGTSLEDELELNGGTE